MLMFLAIIAAEPTTEALKLGREIAEAGTLASLLPMIKEDEIGKVVKDNPELSAAEQAKLRQTADRVFAAGTDKLFAATARGFAERLSIRDLRVAATYARSPTARRMQAATPQVIAASVAAMEGMDFGKDLKAAFCKDTGKLCSAQ